MRAITLAAATLSIGVAAAAAAPAQWAGEWPDTDFSRHSVDLAEIRSGGPPKDGIPSIDEPTFERLSGGVASGWAARLAPTEPVMSVEINGDARAYPLRILMWHEIANDTVGGVPVAVTYCPLCNAAIVFDGRVDDRTLRFGTTGKLRHSDLVMYDRQTESWWQQFTGEAIVGELTGTTLELVPSRLESFEKFAERHPDGRVLVPTRPGMRDYGRNPYVGYDTLGGRPMLYTGDLPEDVEPMERVVVVDAGSGPEAYALPLIREKRRIETGDLVIEWSAGQTSALDHWDIAKGRDVGNVVVTRQWNGKRVDAPHHHTFAFVFHAFEPGRPIHKP